MQVASVAVPTVALESLNMQFPEPTVDIDEIKKKYHAIVEEEEQEEPAGTKKGKKRKKSKTA